VKNKQIPHCQNPKEEKVIPLDNNYMTTNCPGLLYKLGVKLVLCKVFIHTVGTVPKSNRKIVERGKIETP
jgi:hypothetical protein